MIRRSLKLAAALAATVLLLLSVGEFLIGGAMGASPFDQLRWTVATVVPPGSAVAATIVGNIRERSSLPQATALYLLALAMLPIWVSLTR